MGLFDFLKKSEKSDVEKYYDQRNNANNTAYNPMGNQPMGNQPQNFAQPINQGYVHPTPQSDMFPMQNNAFRMIIDDMFSITGRGTVVTGMVATGVVNVGDVINLQHNGLNMQVQVAGIEQFRKKLNHAKEGDYVGIFLYGVLKNDISKGDILTK